MKTRQRPWGSKTVDSFMDIFPARPQDVSEDGYKLIAKTYEHATSLPSAIDMPRQQYLLLIHLLSNVNPGAYYQRADTATLTSNTRYTELAKNIVDAQHNLTKHNHPAFVEWLRCTERCLKRYWWEMCGRDIDLKYISFMGIGENAIGVEVTAAAFEIAHHCHTHYGEMDPLAHFSRVVDLIAHDSGAFCAPVHEWKRQIGALLNGSVDIGNAHTAMLAQLAYILSFSPIL